MVNFLISGSSSQIKPSVSFLAMARKDYKQHQYTDEFDGPSPMQTLGNEKAFKDKFTDRKTVFEKQREDHLSEMQQKIQLLNQAKQTLYNPIDQSNDKLRTPKEMRDDVKRVKEQLIKYNEFKQNQILLGQRERTMKGGWRHGITGIENANSENCSVFYKDKKIDRDFW